MVVVKRRHRAMSSFNMLHQFERNKIFSTGVPHFVISQFVIHAILFQAFLKIQKKSNFFFFFFFFLILIYSFLFIHSECHLMNFLVRYDNYKKFYKHVNLEILFEIQRPDHYTCQVLVYLPSISILIITVFP